MKSFIVKLMALMICFSLNLDQTVAWAEELVILSSRKEPLIEPVINLFEQKTGIKTVIKSGEAAALVQQIIQEQPNPSADIYIAKESGSLEYLRLQGALQTTASKAIEAIPAKYRASDGSWIGVSGRGRALIYNTDLIKKEEVPTTLAELTDPKFKGKIAAVNAGNESFVDWVSALRLTLGDEETRTILEQLKANGIALISKSHTDIRKAVGRGEYPLGLINHYYYHLQKNETDDAVTHVGIVYLDQETGGRGELVNVAGAGIIKNAPHTKAAGQFIDFLTSEEAQRIFAETNFEYPLVAGVEAHPEVMESLNCSHESALNCIKTMDVTLDQLGPELEETTKLLDDVNWN